MTLTLNRDFCMNAAYLRAKMNVCTHVLKQTFLSLTKILAGYENKKTIKLLH